MKNWKPYISYIITPFINLYFTVHPVLNPFTIQSPKESSNIQRDKLWKEKM